MAEPAGAWVYAVVPGEVAAAPAGVRGWAGEPVRLVRAAGLAAVVGSIPPDMAGEEPLRRRLQDPAGLEHVVRGHHQVVTACFRQTPTVPFRMATIYHGHARVRELLAERAPQLQAALASVTGRAEWGVQAYAEPPAPAAAPAGGDQHRPGTAYLFQRREERARQEQARAAARTAAQRLGTALAAVAVAVHRPEAAGQPGAARPAPAFDASYLVDDGRARELTGVVHALAGQLPQLRIRLTGPWPAYSFVEVAEEALR